MKSKIEQIVKLLPQPKVEKGKLTLLINSKDRIEFHYHKIAPVIQNNRNELNINDNEWQQEYFVIYNSYILED
jgi:hypothetical protein